MSLLLQKNFSKCVRLAILKSAVRGVRPVACAVGVLVNERDTGGFERKFIMMNGNLLFTVGSSESNSSFGLHC
jgi:hypothetical protein